MCESCIDTTRPSTIGRRRLLGSALATTAGAALLPGAAVAAAARSQDHPASAPARRRHGLALRWFGTAAWELTWYDRTILLDPWISRFPTVDLNGDFNVDTPLTVDRALIDRTVGDAEMVLTTHGHWDHIADVPYLVERQPSLRVIAPETTAQLLISMGVPPSRLIHVSGGERLNFDGIAVRPVRSLHSRSTNWGYFAPGLRNLPPERPSTISHLVAGETLAYEISFDGGPSVYWSGATDFDELALQGRTPDIAIISMTATKPIERYLERLIRALGRPSILIPNHHDDLQAPLGETIIDEAAIAEFREVARRVSPQSRVVEPVHLEQIAL